MNNVLILIAQVTIICAVLFGGAFIIGTALREVRIEDECEQSVERDCDGNQKVIRFEDLEDRKAYTDSLIEIRDDGIYEIFKIDSEGVLTVRVVP